MEPIQYPVIEVPGRGIYKVKFGMGAQYTLESELGITPQQFSAELQRWVPKKKLDDQGKEVLGEDGKPIIEQPGYVGPSFLFKVLSACLEGQGLKIHPRELADCFEYHQLPDVARVVAEAFSKTRWSAQTPAQEPATQAEPTLRPN
jgi:hypothetical protein